ncbi:hypothetical protein ACROSR_18810 [Roseovarius tibetensis]|uniref:hypothetical protein n=1 Tax=Roseovarius tibetensis TaxID=2685897 RepID=UPI003D7F9207
MPRHRTPDSDTEQIEQAEIRPGLLASLAQDLQDTVIFGHEGCHHAPTRHGH